MFTDPDALRFLVPPTTYARKCIQRMVDTAKPSTLDFKERLFFWSNHSSLWAPVILPFVSQSFRSIYRKREPFFLHPSGLNTWNARHHHTTSWSSVGEATKGGQEWPVPVSCSTKEALLYWVLSCEQSCLCQLIKQQTTWIDGVNVTFRPKPNMWLCVSLLCKTIPCHFMFLTQLSTFWGEDCRVVHSTGFAKRYVPIIFPKSIVRI